MEKSSAPPTLLESGDAARLLGITSQHVRMLTRLGAIDAAFQTPRGLRLYRAEDVLRLRAKREAAA